MNVHPYAAAFPMMADDELDALADDIKANGLLHPVVLDADGVLIDGRNRLAACELAGVDPTFITLADDVNQIDYIRSENNKRRHMTVGQRAMVDAIGMQMQGLRVDGRWTQNARSGNLPDHAKRESWLTYLTQSGLILDAANRWPEEAADLPRQVMHGETPFSTAVEYVKNLESAGALVETRKQQPAREWLFEIAAIETALESLADKPPQLAYPITAADARGHEVTAKKIRAHLRRIAAFIEEQT